MIKARYIHNYLFVCLLFVINSLYACASQRPADQSSSPLLDSIPSLFTLPAKAKFFTTDKLCQTYLVSEDNEVIKFSPAGKEVFRYNNNLLGPLSHIDATNPFNLLLYYEDYLTILTLDRTLNLTGEIRLSELDLLAVKAVGLSNDNQVWLYDEQERKLRKLDQNGQVLFETADVNQLLGTTISPTQLLERDNRVFLNDPQIGIFVFDNFGQYLSKLEIKGAQHLHFRNGFLFFEQAEQALAYELQTLEYSRLPLPVPADQWRVEADKLFIQQGTTVKVYEKSELREKQD